MVEVSDEKMSLTDYKKCVTKYNAVMEEKGETVKVEATASRRVL